MAGFIVMIVCIFISLTLLIGLLFIPALNAIIKMTYYEKIEGTVVDKELKWIQTTDSAGRYAHYKYEFNYLGKLYKIEDKGYSYNKKLNIGDQVPIYIKKEHPEIYLYPNRVRDRYICLFTSLAGIIPLLFVLVFIFFI